MEFKPEINYRALFKQYHMAKMFFENIYKYQLPKYMIPVITGHISNMPRDYPKYILTVCYDNIGVIIIRYLHATIQITKIDETNIGFFLHHPKIKMEMISNIYDKYHRKLLEFHRHQIPELGIIAQITTHLNIIEPTLRKWLLDLNTGLKISNY